MATHQHDQTLESLVSRYRRSATDPTLSKAEIEVEVRFRGVDSFIFETVLKALVAKEIAVDGGTITQTVNSIMEEDPSTRSPQHRSQGGHGRGGNLIRQLTFVDGKKSGERYYRKWPLAPPFRVRNPHALDYNVVLSGEQPLDGAFSSDASALIRAKCRVSFVVAGSPGSDWRIDLTVTRQLAGSDAQSGLSGVVGKMFRAGKMTPANMLDLLGLSDPDSEFRSLYSYEMEIEHLPGADGSSRDAVRPSEVSTLADLVLRLANPEYMEEAVYQAEIYHVAGFVVEAPGLLRRFAHEFGLKKLTPQVTALTLSEYKSVYPPTGYFLLDKADGVRAVASVRDGHLRIMADELLEFYAPGFGPEGKSSSARISADAARVSHSTILDGELVRRAGSHPVFHAFDVMAVRGENLAPAGYEVRISYLEEAVGILRDFGVDARVKPIVTISASEPAELKAQFLSPVFEQRPYGTDGRIVVEPGKPYRDTQAYKWKSLWDTTIDCLARRAPPSVLGRLPYVDAPGHELYFLFVGINPDLFDALGLERVPGYRDLFPTRTNTGSYFPIQFSPSDAPMAYLYQHPLVDPVPARGKKASRDWEGWTPEIEGKVIELRCAGKSGDCAAAGALGTPDWQIVRVRDDRTREIKTGQYFGNDFRIAELTWLNYVDPFEEAQLWNGPTLGYFAAPKSAMYRAQTAYTSYVKSRRIEADLTHARWVVDAAIGKGQDFGRYVQASVRHLVGIDQDQGALSELIRRKFSHANGRTAGKGGKGGKGGRGADRGNRRAARDPTTLFALRADLTSPHADVAAKVRSIVGFPAGGADALVSNLAIHYFAGDVVNIRNFAALSRALVKVGGTVIITTMFGSKVHDLLASNDVAAGKSWDSRQDGVLKYSIRRDYAEKGLTKAGQRIGVLLPFSNGEYYEEFLVNVVALVAEFTARGFALVATPGFATHFDDFRTRNPTMHKMLSPADFEFLSLYGEIILRRSE
jgi:hypothetical protein